MRTRDSLKVRFARSLEDLERCYSILVQLRPHLTREQFLQGLERFRRKGYRLVLLEEQGRICAVAGFRILEMWSRGRFLYIDDLVVSKELRSQGYGSFLLQWLFTYAQKKGIARVDLDSGVERKDAHRFYERHMKLVAYHYACALEAFS